MSQALEQANEQIDVVEMDRAAIAASNLERSTRFYARLFGFCVVHDGRGAVEAQVVMGAGGEPALALCGRSSADARRTRFTIRVANLEAARAALWNQGVVPVVDRSTAVHQDRYVLIKDPDGHEIALVEQKIATAPGLRARSATPPKLARFETGPRRPTALCM